MTTVELDMRRMELIRDIMDTDSIEVLDKVKRESGEKRGATAPDPEKNGGQGGLIAKDTFGAFASTVAAGRTLKSVSGLSLALSLAAGVLGWILCTLLLVWNSAQTASPLHLAAFQLVWACLNWLFSFVLLRF